MLTVAAWRANDEESPGKTEAADPHLRPTRDRARRSTHAGAARRQARVFPSQPAARAPAAEASQQQQPPHPCSCPFLCDSESSPSSVGCSAAFPGRAAVLAAAWVTELVGRVVAGFEVGAAESSADFGSARAPF